MNVLLMAFTLITSSICYFNAKDIKSNVEGVSYEVLHHQSPVIVPVLIPCNRECAE